MLIGFLGLAVDVGMFYHSRTNLQKVADDAAIAGATEINHPTDICPVKCAALASAKQNNMTNAILTCNPPVFTSPSICVNQPPSTGYHPSGVEVIVSTVTSPSFLQLFGYSAIPISARAVAGLTNTTGLIDVIDPTDDHTLTVSGSGTIDAPNAAIYVDSSSSKAFDVSGGACVTASLIGIVGGVDQDACSHPLQTQAGFVTDLTPVPGDPLAWVQAPPRPLPSSCLPALTVTASTPEPIPAGTYCGGIKVPSIAGVTFSSGTYILAGGGLTISGGATVNGTGVTFYNTEDPTGKTSYNGITISGGSSVSLSAPTSGPLQGMLFFQDRNLPLTDQYAKGDTISGGSATSLIGALYFPLTKMLTYSGGSSTTTSPANYIDIVAYKLTVSGPSKIASSATSGPAYSASLTE
jgi:Flp pilus assembly protein TadG